VRKAGSGSVVERVNIIAAMERWSMGFIEQPNSIVGDLPVCPFAKAARLRGSIRFEVLPFDQADPLEPDGALLSLVRELAHDDTLETLFVIHPERHGIGVRALEAFVARLNGRLAEDDPTREFRVFEAHPESEFCIGGVFTATGALSELPGLESKTP